MSSVLLRNEDDAHLEKEPRRGAASELVRLTMSARRVGAPASLSIGKGRDRGETRSIGERAARRCRQGRHSGSVCREYVGELTLAWVSVAKLPRLQLTSADSLRVDSPFRRVACRSETGGGPSSPGVLQLRYVLSRSVAECSRSH